MSMFSEYLCEKLNEKGMSQADLSRKSGLSTGLIAQVFSGMTKDPRISTIIAICDSLEIDIDEAASVFAESKKGVVK